MIVPFRDLLNIKKELGEINFLDYSRVSLIDAHCRLGEEVGGQVRQHLRHRLDTIPEERLAAVLFQARACWLALEERRQSRALPEVIRKALHQYRECLSAWAEGCGIAGMRHPALSSLSLVERAMFLQHDNTGCQTGIYRQANGHLVLWHTEEDSGEESEGRFDQLRVAIFRTMGANGPALVLAFIYPDLLPGSAFAWRSDGYVQAVDALRLKPFTGLEPRLLANIASWVTLFLGTLAPAGQVIEALGPYYDGYALNTIYKQPDCLVGKKHEFVYDLIRHKRLASDPGSILFQANAFSRGYSSNALRLMENLNPRGRSVFEQREQRAHAALDEMEAQFYANTTPFLARLMTSRRGGKRAYSNKDVKARLIARLGPQEAEIWVDGGPGVPNEPYQVLNYTY